MPIKRRDILILVTIWSLSCIAVLVLIGLFMGRSSRPEPAADQPEAAATFVIPFQGQTAKAAYLLALKEAQAWQQDVEVVAIASHWSNTRVESLGRAEVWDFRFFSPGRERLLFALVADGGRVTSRAHLYRLKGVPGRIDPAKWVIDSDEAITVWANNGGGIFLKNYPGSGVEAILRQHPTDPAPVWDIIGISGDQSQIFYLGVDANTGRVIN